ncbi:type 1 glutamine amidotransferase domain-containing protein [Marilutibacter alkalisoli]|nr:type 1 glutamine amidotransferase domain-containing protein [Lysobacter alkalisoli]
MPAFMIHRLRRILGVLLVCALAPLQAVAASPGQDRVLIIVSGEGRDQGKTRPGFEMDELAQAWHVFRDNGLAVDIASPRGGKVEADRFDPEEPFNARLLADPEAVEKLASTRATSSLQAEDYAAVYVVGGKGAMFDLPEDQALRSLLAGVYERGGVVAAVCHGPAALVDVRLQDGRLLVEGRRVTGFSNEEESVFGKKWAKQFRFLIEDAMRERGALWEEAPLMMPKLVVDGRLITGQNPYSSAAVAEAVVRATGRTPVARTPWRDEATMALVQRLLQGEDGSVRSELAADTARFHPELIGLLGYYQLQVAAGDDAVRDALAIMQLAQSHMLAPQLEVGIAEAQWRLGDAGQARQRLAKVLATHPELDEARTLQAKMEQ